MISSQDGSARRSPKTLRVRAFCICRARPHSHLHHADHIKWQTDPGSQMAALDQTSLILKELQSDVRSASRPQTTGASSVVVGHPLDTVKTRLQAGKGYKSTLHCILTIYKKETVAGFFKGMSFPLASITVYNSAVFGFFSNIQRLISNYRYGDGWHPCSMLDLTVASMLTGLMSVGLGAPVDLVKIRLQMQTQTVLAENLHFAGNVSNGTNIPLRSVSIPSQQLYRGPIRCISSILQTEGLQGLYRGAGAMILRDVPGYTLYFIPYAIFCDLLRPDATSSPHPCSILMAGGLAAELTEPNDGAHSYTKGADRQFPTLSADSHSSG